MAFYKLNYLQWNGQGDFSEEEISIIKEYSNGWINIVADIPSVQDVDFIDLDASSQIFLQSASKNGGWLYLKDLESDDLDALRAFAERYWRGGDAGEGTVGNVLPDSLSTAGTRLANFKEKLAVHRERFHF